MKGHIIDAILALIVWAVMATFAVWIVIAAFRSAYSG